MPFWGTWLDLTWGTVGSMSDVRERWLNKWISDYYDFFSYSINAALYVGRVSELSLFVSLIFTSVLSESLLSSKCLFYLMLQKFINSNYPRHTWKRDFSSYEFLLVKQRRCSESIQWCFFRIKRSQQLFWGIGITQVFMFPCVCGVRAASLCTDSNNSLFFLRHLKLGNNIAQATTGPLKKCHMDVMIVTGYSQGMTKGAQQAFTSVSPPDNTRNKASHVERDSLRFLMVLLDSKKWNKAVRLTCFSAGVGRISHEMVIFPRTF